MTRRPQRQANRDAAAPAAGAGSRLADVSRETSAASDHIGDAAAFATAFDVSRETLARLTTYSGLLAQWQRTINLVAPGTLPDVWHRHFADSAQIIAHVPTEARCLADLGSGAGFPGLVLAILAVDSAVRPAGNALSVTLVESDTRKAAFLREVARQVGIAVDIMSTRIESIPKSGNDSTFDVITSRALAALPRLLDIAHPLFSSRSVGLFLKGQAVESEIDEARKGWEFDIQLMPSRTDRAGRIAVIRHLERKRGGPIP